MVKHTFFTIFIPGANTFVGRTPAYYSGKLALSKTTPRVFSRLQHVIQHLKNNKSQFDALCKAGKNAIVVKKTEVLDFDEFSFYVVEQRSESATYQDVLNGKMNAQPKRKYKKFPFEFYIKILNPSTGKYYSDDYRRFNKFGKVWQNLPSFMTALRRISEFKHLEPQFTNGCIIDLVAFPGGKGGKNPAATITITPETFKNLDKTKEMIENTLEMFDFPAKFSTFDNSKGDKA